MAPSPHVPVWEFTPQQRNVLRPLLEGQAPKTIALRHGVAVRTVYWHIQNVYRLVGAHSTGELFAWVNWHRDCCSLTLLLEADRFRATRAS